MGLEKWAFVPGLYKMVFQMGCKAAWMDHFSKTFSPHYLQMFSAFIIPIDSPPQHTHPGTSPYELRICVG